VVQPGICEKELRGDGVVEQRVNYNTSPPPKDWGCVNNDSQDLDKAILDGAGRQEALGQCMGLSRAFIVNHFK
jgi:hypothetical protein